MQVLLNNNNSKLIIHKNFTEDLFDLLNELPFIVEPPIQIFGRTANQRRDIVFISNESEGYRYSNQIIKSIPFTVCPKLLTLMNYINEHLKCSFNGILVNRYCNGTKYIGKHSDDESALDNNNKIVASISYGATRKFRIRNKKTNEIVLDYNQECMTLLIMEGDFQNHYTHEISQQKKIEDCRISITFRRHIK